MREVGDCSLRQRKQHQEACDEAGSHESEAKSDIGAVSPGLPDEAIVEPQATFARIPLRNGVLDVVSISEVLHPQSEVKAAHGAAGPGKGQPTVRDGVSPLRD